MKTLNFWRTLLFTVMAAAAFTACSNDDNDEPSGGAPSITVNGGPTANVGVTLEGNLKTDAITVVSSGTWELTYSDGASSWITASKLGGGAGTSSLTFAVAANTEPREATITLKTKGTVSGFPIEKAATIVIKQSKGGSSGAAIYSNNFDVSKVEKDAQGRWPFLDQSEVWKNATGTGNSTVAYESANVSVRSSGKPSGGYPNSSSVNKIFFGAVPATFSINKITLPAGAKNFRLVFGGAYSVMVGENYDNIFKPESFHVTLGNGTAWSGNVTYTKIGGDDTADPFWVYFAADFTLTAAIPELSVKFTANLPSGFAIDDVLLTEGNGGQQIEFTGDIPSTDPVISSVSPSSLSFAIAGETKSVAVTTANADGCTLAVTSSNVQFVPTASGLTSVSVVAAANAGVTTINGTLTINLMKDGAVKSTKTVSMSQAAPGAPGELSTTIVMKDVPAYAAVGTGNVAAGTITAAPFTLVIAQATGSSAPKYYGNAGFESVRMYAANTMTITGATIIKVEFTYTTPTGSPLQVFNNMQAATGAISTDSETAQTWTGSASEIVFNCNPGKDENSKLFQSRIVSMKIYYIE